MKTLLITGGTGGLGTTVVQTLLREYRCVVLYHGESSFEALRATVAADAPLDGVAANLGDEASVVHAVREAATRHGGLFGVVHLAGGFAMAPLSSTALDAWNGMFALNATSAMLVFREVLPFLDRKTGGRIIAISSEATLAKSEASAAYTVSKSALNLTIELLAKELRGSGITANALLPSTLDTAASREAMPDARRVPLAHVAETIRFLLSDAGASINGALIPLQ